MIEVENTFSAPWMRMGTRAREAIAGPIFAEEPAEDVEQTQINSRCCGDGIEINGGGETLVK